VIADVIVSKEPISDDDGRDDIEEDCLERSQVFQQTNTRTTTAADDAEHLCPCR